MRMIDLNGIFLSIGLEATLKLDATKFGEDRMVEFLFIILVCLIQHLFLC